VQFITAWQHAWHALHADVCAYMPGPVLQQQMKRLLQDHSHKRHGTCTRACICQFSRVSKNWICATSISCEAAASRRVRTQPLPLTTSADSAVAHVTAKGSSPAAARRQYQPSSTQQVSLEAAMQRQYRHRVWASDVVTLAELLPLYTLSGIPRRAQINPCSVACLMHCCRGDNSAECSWPHLRLLLSW
jgi:hypothetical protein